MKRWFITKSNFTRSFPIKIKFKTNFIYSLLFSSFFYLLQFRDTILKFQIYSRLNIYVSKIYIYIYFDRRANSSSVEFDHVKQLVKFYASANLILPARGLPCCRWPYRRFLNASPPLTSDISREEESNVALKKEKSEFQILALNYLFLLQSKYRSEKFPFLVRNMLLITQLSLFDLFEQKNWRRLL